MASQAIRDLLWVLKSPSLITGSQVVEPVAIEGDDIDESLLDAFLAERRGHRVGRYFESLVLFWLEHIRQVEIVASAVQIRDEKRTLGEIDFLFRDECGRLNHWETAVKFFLHFPRAEGSHYPGPNASDNFERKMTKLFDRQLKLSERHYPDVEVRRAFVKGMIFYHPAARVPEVWPERLAEEHLQGRWIRESELERLGVYAEAEGQILDKPFWLAPPDPHKGLPIPELSKQLKRHFSESSHPLLLSLNSPQHDEFESTFVVPDAWPGRDQRAR